MNLAIESISLELQPSELLDKATVHRYVAEMGSGAKIDPVLVYYNGTAYVLADGFHRIAAAKLLKMDTIDADVGKESVNDLQEEWRQYLISAERDGIKL